MFAAGLGQTVQDNTSGYMSPEYIRGEISIKTDVYSFGVLVLEIMSGRKHYATHNGQTEDLLTYIWEKWEQGTPEDSIDPILGNGLQEMMLRCIHIGLLGVQEDPRMRPTMAEVVIMLSSSTVTLPVPSRPAFLSTYSASYVSCTMTSDSVEYASRNDVTLAALSAR
ncbi:hypothetical protein SASPL_144617 [Salvia splendens]|uniref:Protein kinase domain-containing protein n=1 Tax=Salvia splendens TaxID=180675 RepID=A0A8X8WG53_SALSN|nr:hypothetical protein SASPL_144617 [Salvia splendens]